LGCALVSQVNKDSPAEKAGIKPGDVIVRYNGKNIDDTRHLRNLVAATSPNAKVEVTVFRNGKERTFKVTLGEITSGKSDGENENTDTKSSSSDLGLSVAPLTADKAKQYNLDEGEKGVVVTDVDDGSPAAVAELHPGDLITEVDRQPITNVNEFRDALAKAKDKESVLMLVKRESASRFVIVRQKAKP
jgi:serine protease Do